MLSGAPPFDGDSSAKIIAQQLTVVPPDIRTLRPDVTPELALVLGRMLDKDPGPAVPDGGRGQPRPRRGAAHGGAQPGAAERVTACSRWR